jgi:endogenous inhibitor of DNA gyrase (YacG/DUF329 family)
MTEYGTYMYCPCGKSFHSTDGSPFCSDHCYDIWEEMNEEEIEKEEE